MISIDSGCIMISLKLRSKITSPRVLVIDDEVQLAEVCRAVLHNAGAKAKAIYDGADAEDAIKSFAPDVIISDIRMPEVRGDELLVMLRDNGITTPVIMVTGLERAIRLTFLHYSTSLLNTSSWLELCRMPLISLKPVNSTRLCSNDCTLKVAASLVLMPGRIPHSLTW
jgi:CheY-like chemotaxis protein